MFVFLVIYWVRRPVASYSCNAYRVPVFCFPSSPVNAMFSYQECGYIRDTISRQKNLSWCVRTNRGQSSYTWYSFWSSTICAERVPSFPVTNVPIHVNTSPDSTPIWNACRSRIKLCACIRILCRNAKYSRNSIAQLSSEDNDCKTEDRNAFPSHLAIETDAGKLDKLDRLFLEQSNHTRWGGNRGRLVNWLVRHTSSYSESGNAGICTSEFSLQSNSVRPAGRSGMPNSQFESHIRIVRLAGRAGNDRRRFAEQCKACNDEGRLSSRTMRFCLQDSVSRESGSMGKVIRWLVLQTRWARPRGRGGNERREFISHSSRVRDAGSVGKYVSRFRQQSSSNKFGGNAGNAMSWFA